MSSPPVKKCVICGKKGAGFYLNGTAVSCSACKQFFYRNHTKLSRFRCFGNHGTTGLFVDPKLLGNSLKHRKSTKSPPQSSFYCKHCRLKRCLQAGMVAPAKVLPDSVAQQTESKKHVVSKGISAFDQLWFNVVQEQLLAGIEKEEEEPKIEENSDKTQNRKVSGDVPEHLHSLLSAHESKRLSAVNQAGSAVFVDESNIPVVGEMCDLTELVDNLPDSAFAGILTFARMIPGFIQLPVDQKLTALRSFFIEFTIVKNFYNWIDALQGCYRVVNDNPKQRKFASVRLVFETKVRNAENRKRLRYNQSVGKRLRAEMKDDETIRNLVLALMLFNHRAGEASHQKNLEFLRYNFALNRYLLRRYLETSVPGPAAGGHPKSVTARLNAILRVVEEMPGVAANSQNVFATEVDHRRMSFTVMEILRLQ